jgi:nitrogen-specific signal transduction histidine kinase
LAPIPYEACLDALPVGAILVSGTDRILYANQAARRLAPGSGRSGDGTLRNEFPFLREAASAERGEPLTIPHPADPSPGSRDLRVHVRPVRNEDGCRLVVLEEVARWTDSMFQTVSAVRHEINNSLMGLLGQVELLLERADLSEPARQKVGLVQAEAERIRRRVADLSAVRRS